MQVGTSVSHYRLLRQLGEGGMGQVYLADDALLDRRVALKFVRRDDLADPAAHKRLLREARAAASLDHPFICKIFEVGESDEGPFIAMEYLDGQTLEQRLESGPLGTGEALQVAGEIAEALAAAHSHGIVHRDLKPSNVMLTADGHVKVMDFGIAKRVAYEPAATTRSTVSTVDVVAGTLLYMSPEQILGNPITPASDLFALGVVLDEVLTGTHPFKRQTTLATATAIAHEPAPRIQISKPGAGEIDAVIQRLLAKDPSGRYGSADEVVAALRQLAIDSRSREPNTTTRGALRRTWLVLSSVTLIVLVAAIGWLFLRPGPALAFQERDWIVIAALENKTTEKSFDSAIESALTVALRQSRYVNVLPRSRIVDAIRMTGRPESAPLDETLASEVAVREGARAVLACSLASAGDDYTIDARLVDPRTHRSVMAGAIHARNRGDILPALDTLAGRIRHQLGESLESISQQNTALPMATTASLEALKLFVEGRQLAGRDAQAGYNLIREAVRIDPDFAMAHADLAMNASLHGDRATAEQHFDRALKLIDRLTVRERLWIQALAQDSRGNREEAVDAYRAYLSRYPDDADAWYRLGWTLMATLSRPADAIEPFTNVLRINPASPGAYSNLATCYQLLGKNEDSLKNYERAFQLRPAMLTGGFLNHQYGFTLVAVGRVDDARRVFEKMAAESDRDKQATGERSLALLDMYQGRYRDAINHLGSAILLNRSYHNALGELRNRLFIAGAAQALGDHRRFASELREADRLTAAQKLDPGIVSDAGCYYARDGQIRAARRVLEAIVAGLADRTAMSSVNRSSRNDEATVDILQGEIALAEGKWQEAIPLFEVSLKLMPSGDGAEPLARAYVAGKRWDDAARMYARLAAMQSLGNEQQEWIQRSRVELGKIYERQGKRQEARSMYQQCLDRWKDADPDLPLLVEAKRLLAALR
jgi:tetratricopeptide (TPR) repeat protein/tRNA A-37 threonylcarbamoyl transferase component Bud32